MKSFEEIKESVEPQLREVEEFRLGLYRTARTAIFSAVGLVAAGVVVWLFVHHIAAIVGGVALAAAAYFGGYYMQAKKYENEFKQKVLKKVIAAINPKLDYRPQTHISKSKFRESGIFKHHADKFKGEDHISGMIGKTEVEFSELHAQYKTRTTDSKGRTRTSYHTFFKGLFVIADFHKEFKGETIVLPDTAEKFLGFIGKKLQNWNLGREDLVYLESPEFEKEFVVYGSDQVEARYILSTSMMERIMELKRKFNSNVSLSFRNSKVYIAIPMDTDLLDPDFKKSLLDSAELQRFYSELIMCFDIVEQLNLNTRIWSKE